jgi:hypothetical protein
MKNIFLFLVALVSVGTHAQSSSDNQVFIEQVGDTLNLNIQQTGYGNKIGGDDFSSSPADMVITGSGLTFDIDQIGNQNLLYGPVVSDSSSFTTYFSGDSNVLDWNIGYLGSTDSSDFDLSATGDSNTWDIDWGYVTSAERFDFDLTLTGSSNTFTIDVEVDDATLNYTVDGDDNDILSSQTDGAYQYQIVDFTGDSVDMDIIQKSGTCPQGTISCYGHIDLDITSDNATIAITQQDSTD